MDDLHPIRVLYRRRLHKYTLARKLKPIAVALLFKYIQFRNFAVWQVQHRVHSFEFAMNQRVQALNLTVNQRVQSLNHTIATRVNQSAVSSKNLISKISAPLKNVWLSRPVAQFVTYLVSPLISRLASHLAARALALQTSSGDTYYLMMTFNEYAENNKSNVSELCKAETFSLTIPMVYPEEYRKKLQSKIWPLDVPSVQAIEIPHAEIMGKCDFIFFNTLCLHHGLYQFNRDLSMEEMHGMISIHAKKNLLVRYKRKLEQMETIPAAISLIGSANSNYVHWLTETAPKLALIDGIEQYADLPLVIDADLHPNIMESLHCLNSRKRKLIPIKRGQVYRIDKLVAVTAVSYTPFEFRRGRKQDIPDIHPGLSMYVPSGLNLLRQKSVSSFVHEEPKCSTRLYLRRSAQSRQMSNSAEVEALMQEQGFQIIEPEILTFAEQVRLFSSAEIIVGQGGASFGNIIFAPKGCHVIILTTWTPYTVYYYFSNLASLLGQRCSFILCDPVEERDSSHPAHKGLEVDIHYLKKVIDL